MCLSRHVDDGEVTMTDQSTPSGGFEELISRFDEASVGGIDTNEVQRRLDAGNDDSGKIPLN